MNPAWVLRTARLVLTPVGGADLPELRAFKADPSVFAIMQGGVRNPGQAADDLGKGLRRPWTVNDAQGRGLAREAAFAALRFGHERARLKRIIAVARETNFGSRTVLGSIGMRPAETFPQRGHTMILYESLVGPRRKT